jgi:RNA polymerase sigma factor (sigma-70 family)
MEAATASLPAIGVELVQLAARGDEAAFTRIVATHHPDMVRVCLAICGDIGVAEEAAQAAWSLAWRRLPSLRDPDRLRPWLVSIAANQARDTLRRSRRRAVVELEVADAEACAGDPAGHTGDIDLRNAVPMDGRWTGHRDALGQGRTACDGRRRNRHCHRRGANTVRWDSVVRLRSVRPRTRYLR